MRSFTATTLSIAAGLIAGSRACDSCFGPINRVEHVRHVKRMQPDANDATYGPTRGALEWGQLNFLHTVCAPLPGIPMLSDGPLTALHLAPPPPTQTDTHGWLEGHLDEPNYGADWGDMVSFTARMREKAKELGVDLLLVDTGRSS